MRPQTIEKAAAIYNGLDHKKLLYENGLHVALRQADPNWDEGLSFDEAVSALIAVERRAKQLREQEGK